MIKSVLAAVVAIALIVGAFMVRTRFIEGDDTTPVPTGSAEPVRPPDAELRVACDALLAQSCPPGSSRLDLTELLAAFEAQPIAYDALIAPTVVVDVIEQSRTSRARFDANRAILATTPLVLAVSVSRDELVASACGQAVTWLCAADLVQETSLTLATADPQDDTEGIAAVAAMTGGFLDTSAYNTNSLGGGGFLDWVDVLSDQTQISSTPVQQLIQFGGARNDSAVTTEATGLTQVRRAAQNVPDLFWPTPLASLQIVAVAVDGADQAAVDTIGQQTAALLSEQGWRGPDGQPATEGPPLDLDDDGLPSGGTLFTLRDRLS